MWAVDIPGIERSKELEPYIKNIQSYTAVTRSSTQVSCLEFDIISQNPFELDFKGVTELKKCQGLTGLPPNLFQKLLNWIDKCFKKFSPQGDGEENLGGG